MIILKMKVLYMCCTRCDVTANLRSVLFSRDESLDNLVCRLVTDHRNPEDRDTEILQNGYKPLSSYG
jgi:hypothetical protein